MFRVLQPTIIHALQLRRTVGPYGESASCISAGAEAPLRVDYVVLKPFQRIEPHRHDGAD